MPVRLMPNGNVARVNTVEMINPALTHLSLRIPGAFHELLRFYTGQNTDFGAIKLLNGTHFNKYFCNKQILTIFSIEIYIYNKY